jgi:hypothetical protein
LGSIGDGRLWLVADADGATVVSGGPLGAEGERVAFFATLGEGGLADVTPFGTGGWGGRDPLLLPDGDVMVSTEILPGENHTLFGEAVGPGGVLARIDPAGPSLVRTWPVSHAGRLSVTEGDVQLDVGFRLTAVVLGEHTYEPLRDFPTPWEQTFVRIRWDGRGPLPEGERWPTDPSLVAEGGLQWRGLHGSELLLRVDADRRIDRRLSIPMGSGGLRPIDERRLFGVLFAGDGAGALMEEADGEASQQILEPVQPGHRTLWALELDRGSWEILRQRAFDLGPSEGETSALLQRLGDGHLLLGIRREGGLEDAVLEIQRWDGGEPARIPVEVTGTACRAHVDSIHTWEDDERVSFEGAGFQVVAGCEAGPHEVTIAGRSFTYDAANSASWFRIEVAE